MLSLSRCTKLSQKIRNMSSITEPHTPNYLALTSKSYPWKSLVNSTNGVYKHSVVRLSNYGDVLTTRRKIVFLADVVFVEKCNRNFVYHWVNLMTFPNAKKLYLASDPCQADVLMRQFDHIYLHEKYAKYKEAWVKNGDWVTIISEETYIKELEAHKKWAQMLFQTE
jgi:hypothetical protein